jgi:hypothetical protein
LGRRFVCPVSGLDALGNAGSLVSAVAAPALYGLPARSLVTMSPEPLQLPTKIKKKFTLQQAMKAQKGSRGIALLFL